MFKSPDFEVDKETEEYRLLKPLLVQLYKSKLKKLFYEIFSFCFIFNFIVIQANKFQFHHSALFCDWSCFHFLFSLQKFKLGTSEAVA